MSEPPAPDDRPGAPPPGVDGEPIGPTHPPPPARRPGPPVPGPPRPSAPTGHHPGVAAVPPPGPIAPGAPAPSAPPPGWSGPPSGDGPGDQAHGGSGEPPAAKQQGLLISGLIALVVVIVGAMGFVALQAGNDDAGLSPSVADDPDDDGDDVNDVVPVPSVDTTEVATSPPTTASPTTTEVGADGSVDSVFVHVEAFAEVVADAELDETIRRIGLADGNNPVSSADPVLNLCAALPVDRPVAATVTWTLDNVLLSEGAERVFESPADGNCINNSGAPLSPGAYEVSFSDADGSMSGVALFTIGAETVTQEFVNDTDTELCAVELAPIAAGFFQSFEVDGGEPLTPGASILIDVAAVDHEIRGLDCADSSLASFVATPGADPISLASGVAIAPTTTGPPPPAQISDAELGAVDGGIGSLDVAVPAGSDDEQIVIDLLLDPESNLRIATEDTSFAMCAAWDVPGALDGDIVWEFNRAAIARIPVSTTGDRVGGCISPGGEVFDAGVYQAYLQRGEVLSDVETFTLGRVETQLAFRNDTGTAVCRVGFSPNLSNWYSFYDFADSTDFEESVEPGGAFTIVAPFIENDIRAFDCDGNQVSEALDIAPTDQTLNLSTGTP